MNLFATLRRAPIIAAIRRETDIEAAINSNALVTFVLCGDINTLRRMTDRLKQAEKAVFVHVDLIGGLASDQAAVTYLANHVQIDGVISTRGQIVRAAADQGLIGIQRLFVMDSTALETGLKQARSNRVGAVELLPGTLPYWVVDTVREKLRIPVIVGGLLRTRADVTQALELGAAGVSVSDPALWDGPSRNA